jgi:hypothetical protein
MLSFAWADIIVKLDYLIMESQKSVFDLFCLFGHPWSYLLASIDFGFGCIKIYNLTFLSF